ncbi:hypothetical protein YB2330_003573 [Saitoella coloradoensis]
MLLRSHDEEMLWLPVYASPPVTRMTKGRVALLGDAAHCMPPDSGQGASLALDDADVLTLLIQKHDANLSLASQDYDTLRTVRVTRMQEEARKRGRKKMRMSGVQLFVHSVFMVLLSWIFKEEWNTDFGWRAEEAID